MILYSIIYSTFKHVGWDIHTFISDCRVVSMSVQLWWVRVSSVTTYLDYYCALTHILSLLRCRCWTPPGPPRHLCCWIPPVRRSCTLVIVDRQTTRFSVIFLKEQSQHQPQYFWARVETKKISKECSYLIILLNWLYLAWLRESCTCHVHGPI